jgi:hypothetical protein
VPATATLLVGSIAAGVALYSKRLDRIDATEQRHAEARANAYDQVLASGDLAWNFIARNYVSELTTGNPLSSEDKEASVKASVDLLPSGTDHLKTHARDYEALEPVLQEYLNTIFHNRQGSSADYERVRNKILGCRRRDTGLSKQLRDARGWREQLAARRAVKEVRRGIDQVFVDPVNELTLVTADGPAMWALMEEQREWSEGMQASVDLSARRVEVWRGKGICK